MTIAASDVKFRKSMVVSDTTSNGGRKDSEAQVVSGAKHNLFPRVTNAERTAGVTRYRKQFWCNEDTADEIAYAVSIWLEFPSNGDDRFAMALGSQTNTQGDISGSSDILWVGCGQLQTALSGSETSVIVTMESTDFKAVPGGMLHISDKFATSQTVDSDVQIGDSVQYNVDHWEKIAADTDITYPKGLYVGSSVVMTEQGGTNEEFLTIKDQIVDEDIGTGDGSSTTPTLTDLADITNEVMTESGYLPVVTATCGSTQRTVNIAANGACSGYCSAGQLNMADGTWTTDITWTTAPDNATDILISYYDQPWSYSGNNMTIQLDDAVANSYATANTYVACCIDVAEVEGTFDNWGESAAGSGTYDETTYPVDVPSVAEEDTWTLTFTSATEFNIVGTNSGSVGTGDTSTDASPTNPKTGRPYFTLDKDGWADTWATNDYITFKTHPAAVPLWMREVVPAAATAVERNLLVLGWYAE
jgi:hypothetical protein